MQPSAYTWCRAKLRIAFLILVAQPSWLHGAASTPPVTVTCRITADSVHSRSVVDYLFDGNRQDSKRRCLSATTPEPHWVRIEFEAPVDLSRVVIWGQGGEYALADAQLQIRQDGNWETVANVARNEKAVVEFRFPVRTTDGVRLMVTKACRRDTCVRLHELELFNAAQKLDLKPARRLAPRRGKDGPAGPFEPSAGPAALLHSVVPFPDAVKGTHPASPRSRQLMQTYHDAVRRWAVVLRKSARPVADVLDCIHYGMGARTGCYAALINAFLAEFEPPAGGMDPRERARHRKEAVEALRYLVQGHVAGEGVYQAGEGENEAVAWGGRWQSALYVHALGLAGWILWPHLDDDLRAGVCKVLEYDADRFVHVKPKGNVVSNTVAEENAWNAMAIAVACNMMPGHPRNARWREAAQSYMYNTFSTEADRKDETPGDDGRPVRDWVSTVNVHPDFTLENHGQIHIGYIKTSLAELMCCAPAYLLAQREIPTGLMHHVPEMFGTICKCMAWDGAPVYVTGNDWALYHQQEGDLAIYALISLLRSDRLAASLEDRAASWLPRKQETHEGYFNPRRDLTYSSQCCVRLIQCYLAHALLGDTAPSPLTPDEFNSQVSNVTLFPKGRIIVHRTPNRFASFSWGSHPMALAMPRDGNWLLWPHFSSYLGYINGKDTLARGDCRVERVRPEARANGFTVTGRVDRFEGGVIQEFAYVSLVRDITVYIERLTVRNGFKLRSRETGVIGPAYGLGTNERTLHSAAGKTRVTGLGGTDRVIELKSDWLNLEESVGYVGRRREGCANLIRYHDMTRGPRWELQTQEWMSLIGDPQPEWPAQGPDWACVVTFLNQSASETRESTQSTTLEVDGEAGICRIGEDSVKVDFGRDEIRVTERPLP